MIKLGKMQAVLFGFVVFSAVPCWAGTAAPADDWGGFYAGANAGWAGADPHTRTTTPFDTAAYMNVQSDEDDVKELGDQRLSSEDFTGGGQIGYNWQSGLWILGIETDFNALNMDAAATRSKQYISAPTATLTMSSTVKTDWLWTLRPRVGYVVADRWLCYGTGGLTVSDLEADFTLLDDYTAVLGNVKQRQNISKIKAGWTVGGGVEVRLDKNWSVRSEYLYADLGTLEGDADDMTSDGNYKSNVFHHEAEFVVHLVRFSINYKF